MKIWHGLLVGLVMLASCSDSSGSSDAATSAPESSTTATTVAMTSDGVTTTVESSPVTLLPPIDQANFDSVATAVGTASSTCDFFAPGDTGNWFAPTDCARWPNVGIEAVTIWCPSDDCETEFEVVVELAGDFQLTSPNLLEGVDIRIDGSAGTISCIARQNYGQPEFGCLDDNGRFTIPPEDVWFNSEDGLRHRFGAGATFIGAVETVSVNVTLLGADNAGPVGVFTVLEPEIPARYEPQRVHDADVARRLGLALVTELTLANADEIDCVVDAAIDGVDLATFSAGAGHGVSNMGDAVVTVIGEALEECDPIRPQYAIALGAAGSLPESCDVESVTEALAAEFAWTRVVADVRAAARLEAGPLEQSSIFEAFRAAAYEEFDCLSDQ